MSDDEKSEVSPSSSDGTSNSASIDESLNAALEFLTISQKSLDEGSSSNAGSDPDLSRGRTAEVESVHETIVNFHRTEYPTECYEYMSDYKVSHINLGVRVLGIENFLRKAAQFCKDEVHAKNAEEEDATIISVNSYNGTLEDLIVKAYYKRFGEDITIVRVGSHQEYVGSGVDYRSIDELVEARPSVVRNCILFVNWASKKTAQYVHYDIVQALHKLKPRAALTVYEMSGVNGYSDWCDFLNDNRVNDLRPEDHGTLGWQTYCLENKRDFGLGHYVQEELAFQQLYIGPVMGATYFRLIKLYRKTEDTGESTTPPPEEAEEAVVSYKPQIPIISEGNHLRVSSSEAEKYDCAEELQTVLTTLRLHDRSLDYNHLVKQAKVDYSQLDPTKELDHAKIMLNAHLSFTELPDFRDEVKKLHPLQLKKPELDKYRDGVIALGVDEFLLKAVEFCHEAPRNYEIISVGSGDGTAEKMIRKIFRQRFNKKIKIKLVDSDPAFKSHVKYQSVADLMAKRPHVEGKCVLLLVWPKRAGLNKGEDVEAIRKLQPDSVLIVYESTGRSGSHDLREYLHETSLDLSPSSENYGFQNYLDQSCRRPAQVNGLANYTIKEIDRQRVQLRPISGTFTIRMVKLMKRRKIEEK